MKIKERVKRAIKKPFRQPELTMWQERMEKAKKAYQKQYTQMDEREALYKGTKKIDGKMDGTKAAKDASHTRNIIFELVESQIDSNIPIPKISTNCEHCEGLAHTVEESLRADMGRLPFKRLNDEQERTTPIQGGSYFYVEWDNTKRTHNTTGDLAISVLHPKQVVPQPGVTNIDQMDYVFVLFSRTKEYIKQRYGVDVENEDESAPDVSTTLDQVTESDDKVTQCIAYYRNKEGGIGIFSWVNDTVLEDMEDYQARQLERCTVCGKLRPYDSNECECGNGKFQKGKLDEEELSEDVVRSDGEIIPAYGQGIDGEMVQTKLPYYKPNKFPIVLRKNVSAFGQLLGDSDLDKIRDQQMLINKLGTKIEEKLLKGGSFVSLPKGLNFRKDDSEFKILEVKSPSDLDMIQVQTLQPNITYDSTERDKAYIEAKSTLGITDTFQGKPDTTAQSGKAKQLQIEQSAGRLESKRRMKNAAYQDLFELMFKFKLAYADEPRPFVAENKQGHKEYQEFNRYDFLERDEAGEWYYNDNFLFDVDASGTLANNREAMWQETRMNFQEGALGDPSQPETLIMFWQLMETLHYPMAGKIKAQIEAQLQRQQEMMAMQQQMVQQQALMGQTAQQQIQPSNDSSEGDSTGQGLDDIIQMLEVWDG